MTSVLYERKRPIEVRFCSGPGLNQTREWIIQVQYQDGYQSSILERFFWICKRIIDRFQRYAKVLARSVFLRK